MLVNRIEKIIEVKVVYFGPALSGKTTNLEVLHRMVPEGERPELTSLRTEGDRTLFFDFLPLAIEGMGGWRIHVKTFTVPGQVQYESTRRQILQGADGIAFVADSSPGAQAENLHALRQLRVSLKANGIDPQLTPVVLQYNKRDLRDAVPVALMEATFNSERLPCVEAMALRGSGVRETFISLATRVVGQVPDRVRRGRISPAEIRETMGKLLSVEPEMAASAALAPQDTATGTPAGRSSSSYDLGAMHGSRTRPEEGMLLKQALTSNVSMATDLAAAASSLRRFERSRQQMKALAALAMEGSAPERLQSLLASLAGAAGAGAASLLVLRARSGTLETVACHGLGTEPLNVAQGRKGAVAVDLLAVFRAGILRDHMARALPGESERVPDLGRLRATVVAPLAALGRPIGLLLLHALDAPPGWAPSDDDVAYVQAAAGLLIPHALGARSAVPVLA